MTAAADGHQTTTAQGITVLGVDIDWVNIEMGSGVVGAVGDGTGGTVTHTASGGGYCFISSGRRPMVGMKQGSSGSCGA